MKRTRTFRGWTSLWRFGPVALGLYLAATDWNTIHQGFLAAPVAPGDHDV